MSRRITHKIFSKMNTMDTNQNNQMRFIAHRVYSTKIDWCNFRYDKCKTITMTKGDMMIKLMFIKLSSCPSTTGETVT